MANKVINSTDVSSLSSLQWPLQSEAIGKEGRKGGETRGFQLSVENKLVGLL